MQVIRMSDSQPGYLRLSKNQTKCTAITGTGKCTVNGFMQLNKRDVHNRLSGCPFVAGTILEGYTVIARYRFVLPVLNIYNKNYCKKFVNLCYETMTDDTLRTFTPVRCDR
jgi:hypothetical protein